MGTEIIVGGIKATLSKSNEDKQHALWYLQR